MAEVVDILRVELARLVAGGDYRPDHLALLAGAIMKGALTMAKLDAEADRDAADSALANVLADLTALKRG